MTKTYELPKGRLIVAEFDENGVGKITVQALDSLICELNEYTERQSGKWIIKEDNTSYVKTIPRRWAECSCCKWSMSLGYVDRYAFCPNCGAKMVEPQESEDKE